MNSHKSRSVSLINPLLLEELANQLVIVSEEQKMSKDSR